MFSHPKTFAVFLLLALVLCVARVAVVRSESGAVLRLTVTPDERLSLNPSISGDGRRVGFESSADVAEAGGEGFHALLADLSHNSPRFLRMALARASAPALSQDGSRVAFSSRDDPLGTNPDGNSEIFLFDGQRLAQITDTKPDDASRRASDGSFQPSISDDGRLVAFSSNRNLAGSNPDANLEIFVYDTETLAFRQLTESVGTVGATDAKLSGDGSRVAFIRDAGAHGSLASTRRDLVLSDLSSGETRLLAAALDGFAFTYGRAVSDDGERIVFSARTATNASQVFLYDGRRNILRRLTSLGSRASDVPLHPTVSGDGSRVAFATRRSVTGANADASVELYVYDLPTDQFTRITSAPASATAEVVSSLDDAGITVAFSFPRVLASATASNELANNSEIYVADLAPRPAFSTDLRVSNAAASDREPASLKSIAPGSIADAFGANLSDESLQAARLPDRSFPRSLAGVTVSVNKRAAQLFYVSPERVNFLVPEETELGTAEVSVRNAEGFESRASVLITQVSPGLFTHSADGRGETIALNASTLQRTPFDTLDAAGNPARLIIFATGLRYSSDASLSIGRRTLKIESIVPSNDLPGLEQIHVALPRALRGAGSQTLVVRASGRESNPARISITNAAGVPRPAAISIKPASATIPVGGTLKLSAVVFDGLGDEIGDAPVTFNSSAAAVASIDGTGLARGVGEGASSITAISGSVSASAQLRVLARTLVVNEVLADPPDGLAGDANQDGIRSGTDDEFVELVNASGSTLDLSGWTIRTRSLTSTNETTRHTFPPGATLAPDDALVVFGGGTPDPQHPAFGGAQIFKATSASGLSLTNSALFIFLRDTEGNLVSQMSYGTAGENPAGASINQSLTREPDVSGHFVPHQTARASGGKRFSPGTKLDGSFFLARERHLKSISLQPVSQSVYAGEPALFTAEPLDQFGHPLKGITLTFTSNAPAVASVASQTTDAETGIVTATVEAHAQGVAELVATSTDGVSNVNSNPATLNVLSPTPTPTPTPSPTPRPSPTPTPSPSASPTPKPSPSPAPSPSPSPTPSPPTARSVRISQIYGGGGNSGAPFKNDFIELFNQGDVSVGLDGWSVQYAGATSATWSKTELSGTLAPGQFYLVQQSAGTAAASPLPTPDATGSIQMSATAGKVALTNNNTLLSGACPSGANLIDLVGYGAANCFEGAAPASALNNTTAALRRDGGCTDSDQNSSDFDAAAPNPRNTSSQPTPCASNPNSATLAKAFKRFLSETLLHVGLHLQFTRLSPAAKKQSPVADSVVSATGEFFDDVFRLNFSDSFGLILSRRLQRTTPLSGLEALA
ncbi:MAG TPA: lamin tail domain-containing protein [Pyrinomonadaceae bacterium]